MKVRQVPMSLASGAPKSWLKRFGWLALIWVLGVAALGIVAVIFRLLMNAAGLTA